MCECKINNLKWFWHIDVTTDYKIDNYSFPWTYSFGKWASTLHQNISLKPHVFIQMEWKLAIANNNKAATLLLSILEQVQNNLLTMDTNLQPTYLKCAFRI